jgi:hypothetical protein
MFAELGAWLEVTIPIEAGYDRRTRPRACPFFGRVTSG